MTLRMDTFVSCIKIFGVPIVPPLMTDEKIQEMKEYKEKAMAFEQKLKGKRVSLDSGVMIASMEIQNLDNYESPTNVLKEPVYYDVKNINQITTRNKTRSESLTSSETLTVSEEKEHNLNVGSSNKESINIMSDHVGLVDNSCEILIPKQKVTDILMISNNDNSFEKESISTISDNVILTENSCDITSKPESTQLLSVTSTTTNGVESLPSEQLPRLRSNSYTLSSPSPIMVAFLNSQVQQQLLEPKINNNNVSYKLLNKSQSEPSSIYTAHECNDILKAKSISLCSVPGSFHNQELMNSLLKYKHSTVLSKNIDDKFVSDQKQDEIESVTTIGTNLSNNESLVESVITVFNGNSYENNSSPSSLTCSKSVKHCCCKHSDDEYSLSSNNIHYKTPEELNLEAERLRIAKLDIEKRHQEELSYLIKKQREEQEQIAVRYYLVMQNSSVISSNDSECSEYISKQFKTSPSSIQSGITMTNDKSLISDTSSIISNCSLNKNLVCSSPKQKTSRSPYLQQNIKFYHRICGGLTSKWTKAPTEVESAAATIINAGVRGYLTRRLLRTEKAQLLKKTIVDSVKTALIFHSELKEQQLTESDLELHQRVINQLTTACYDLNDLILGSIHERMTIIRGDRERLKAVKMRQKSSSVLINKVSQSLRKPKKSTSGYSLSKRASSNYSEKSFNKKY